MNLPAPRYRNAALATFTTLLLALATVPRARADTAALEAELKAVFAKWSKAMTDSDKTAWAATTARYRQIGTRNLIVSQMRRWPDSLFDTPVSPPDVSKMTLARTMVNGITAQLVYFGKADFGVAEEDEVEIPDGMLFLMFVKEPSGWKFNTSRFMSLAGAEEVGDQATAGDFSFLDAPEFRPPGTVPPLPKPCKYPEVVAFIEIVSIGYETQLKVDEHSNHTVIDNVQTGLIIGGLKRGINPISVRTRPLPAGADGKEPKRHFEFSIFRKAKRPGEPAKRIYHSGVKKTPGSFKVMVRGEG